MSDETPQETVTRAANEIQRLTKFAIFETDPAAIEQRVKNWIEAAYPGGRVTDIKIDGNDVIFSWTPPLDMIELNLTIDEGFEDE